MKPQNIHEKTSEARVPLIDVVDPHLLPFLAAILALLLVAGGLVATFGFAALVTILQVETALMFGILIFLTRGKP